MSAPPEVAAPGPPRPWRVGMRWTHLLFAHWPLPRARLRPLVPPPLALETFDGDAWLGLVPFRMERVRLRPLPPVPGTATFPELNVRTYVREPGGLPGVLFLSLDAASALAVAGARVRFGLPYFFARMACERAGDRVRYRSVRRHPGAPPAVLRARYRPTGPPLAEPDALARFLTDRARLFTVRRGGRVRAAEVRHDPWPLQPAEAELEENGMAAAHGLTLPDAPPLLHYSARVDVRAWAPAPPGE